MAVTMLTDIVAPAAGIRPTPTATQASTGETSENATTLNPAVDASSVYERIGFYDSAAQILDNLVFLANLGGQGSGCWDEYDNLLSCFESWLTELPGCTETRSRMSTVLEQAVLSPPRFLLTRQSHLARR